MEETKYSNVTGNTIHDDVKDIKTKVSHILDYEKSAHEKNNYKGEDNMSLTTTSMVVPTIDSYGYGRGHAVSYGDLTSYHTGRDVLHNGSQNAILHGVTDRNVDNKFAFSNLEQANGNAVIRERITSDGQTTRDQAGANARFIEGSVLSNRNLTERMFDNVISNFRAVDGRLCGIETTIAANSVKLDTMFNNNQMQLNMKALMANNFNLGSCQPTNASCGGN